jgi:hypothetical protein
MNPAGTEFTRFSVDQLDAPDGIAPFVVHHAADVVIRCVEDANSHRRIAVVVNCVIVAVAAD